MWRDCALSSRQPHLNVFTSSGECYVSEAYGADTIVIPQQHRQPAVDLGGEDIPFQQPSDTMHHSIGISDGGRGDGDALGTDVPSGGGDNDENDWNRGVTRQQQLHMQHNGGVVETSGAPGRGSGGDGEGGGGPLSGTFSGGDDGVVYGGFFALQLVCSFTPNPSSQMLSAISSLFANRRPGSTIFLGDTGAVIHGVSSADCVYNRRQPRPWERYLMLGDGKCMTVDFYGDLDVDLRCEQDVRVTLTNVAVVPGLAFDIMSFNRMQEKHEIILNGAGASMLGGRARFKTFRAGNFFQATRVPHDDTSPHAPAMVAAMMRPGAPSSMDVNDFHNSLGHANIKTLYEAAKQLGIKLTGIPFGYHHQAFQGEVPTWGWGAITSSRSWSSTAASPGAAPNPLAAATSSRGGVLPPRHRRRQQLRVGGAFLPCFHLKRRLLRWQRRHLHAVGVLPPRHRRRQQLRAGGAFLPCFHLERRLLRWQRRHLHAVGVFPPRHRRRQQLRVGGAFLPCFHLDWRLLRWQRRHLHAAGVSRRDTGGVSSSAWGGHSSHVFVWSGGYFGDIFPRRGHSRRGSSDVYFVGSGDTFPRRGYLRRGSCGAYATRARPFRCSRNSYRE